MRRNSRSPQEGCLLPVKVKPQRRVDNAVKTHPSCACSFSNRTRYSAKASKARLDRRRSGQVHTSSFQEVDAEVRRPALEEGEVTLHRRCPFRQDLASQSRRGRDSGGVLVDVERVVEVRNPRPLDVDQVIDLDRGTVVLLVQRLVDLAEQIRRQRLTGFGASMCFAFEFSEQRLPNQSGTDALQLRVDDVEPHLRGPWSC